MTMIPTVHLNGTARADLIEQYRGQAEALGKVIDMIERNGPNARDYYPQGAHAHDGTPYQKARSEHSDRMQKLIAVFSELQEIARSLEA